MLAHIRRLVRDALGILPTLDLHGLSVRDAVRETDRFLRDSRARGVASLRIVYGKGRGSPGGRGVLREVIPRWLDTEGQELVQYYERRPDASGADGSLIVWLRVAGASQRRTADGR